MGSLSLLQGDLPNPGIEPRSPALQADFFISSVTREAFIVLVVDIFFPLRIQQ